MRLKAPLYILKQRAEGTSKRSRNIAQKLRIILAQRKRIEEFERKRASA